MSSVFVGGQLPPPFPGAPSPHGAGPADDRPGRLGDNVVWAWKALSGNFGWAILNSVLLVAGVSAGLVAAGVVWWGASRVPSLLPLAVLVGPALVLVGLAVGLALCLSFWDQLAGLESPSGASGNMAPARVGAVVGTAALLLPMSLLPLTGGALFAALHLAMGGGLGPVGAVSEALSRCTDSARAFGRTLLVGLLLQVYLVAVWLLVWVAVPGVAVALSGTSALLPGGLAVDSGSFVAGALGALALAVSLAVAFGFLHLVGLSTAAWTRQLAGESVAPAPRSARAWQGFLVVGVVLALCTITGGVSALVSRNAWVPDGYERFGSGFAYRFVDEGSECAVDGGCFFVEVVVRTSCPEGVEVTLEESEKGRRLGTTSGSSDDADYATVPVPSLSARETTATVESISCR